MLLYYYEYFNLQRRNFLRLKIFVFNEIVISEIFKGGVNEKLGKRRKTKVIVHGI